MSLVNDISSYAASIVRLGRGLTPAVTAEHRPEPAQMLELYEFEGCPYCRKVREVLCELDLDYLVHPVAHGGMRRDALKRLGGKVQAPYLVDPNTGVSMYESDDINAYLNQTYGAGAYAGWSLTIPSVVDNLGSFVASAVRAGRGSRCRHLPRRKRLEPLTLYNMEASPYCRKVREALSELDLEHIIRNLPKGSPKRTELIARGGKMQVPYLVDPNTGKELYESDEIVAYLDALYGQGTDRNAARAIAVPAPARSEGGAT